MTDSPPTSNVCQRLLEEHRDTLNARFLARRAQGVPIDADIWLEHLSRRILPMVDLVHHSLPERAGRALLDLYDVSLDLFTLGHFNETEGVLPQALSRLWEQTLPLIAHVVARAPRQTAGSLSNAVLSIAQSKRQSVSKWLQKLDAIHAHIESPEQLLGAGQVAAWAAGMAEYRIAALKIAKQLPPAIVSVLLDLHLSTTEEDVQRQLNEWTIDPWSYIFDDRSNTVQIVKVCGAFRGFSGDFMRPPRVVASGSQLLVTDEIDTWQIMADRFGHSFHRSEVKLNDFPPQHHDKPPQIDAQGRLHWGSDRVSFPELKPIASHAFDGQTLAITLKNSFHVYLVARSSDVVMRQGGSAA